MALHDILLEEHTGWFEDIQGNVNVSGLVYEETLVSTAFLDDPVYIVWIEQVDESVDVSPSFQASHEPYCLLQETLTVLESVGVPAEVYDSLLRVVHARDIAPVQVWWVGFNAVHGPDTFFEEVTTHCHVTEPTVQAVPYYWEYIHESLGVSFSNIEPLPPVTVARKMVVSDLVNMRHDVIFEYHFVCSCHDGLFVFERHWWGWTKTVEENVELVPGVQGITGLMADDWMGTDCTLLETVNGQELVNCDAFIWDTSEHGQTFRELVSTLLDVSGVASVGLDLLLEEPLRLALEASGHMRLMARVIERATVKDAGAPCWELTADETLGMADAMGMILELYCACSEAMDISPEALGAMAILLAVDELSGLSEGVS